MEKWKGFPFRFILRIETGFYLDEFDSVHILFRKYVCVFLLLHFVNIDLVHCESMREQRCAHITRTKSIQTEQSRKMLRDQGSVFLIRSQQMHSYYKYTKSNCQWKKNESKTKKTKLQQLLLLFYKDRQW